MWGRALQGSEMRLRSRSVRGWGVFETGKLRKQLSLLVSRLRFGVLRIGRLVDSGPHI